MSTVTMICVFAAYVVDCTHRSWPAVKLHVQIIYLISSASTDNLTRERERENFIRHRNMNKNHTMERSHEWQVARKGITPIELATLKKQNKLTQEMQ